MANSIDVATRSTKVRDPCPGFDTLRVLTIVSTPTWAVAFLLDLVLFELPSDFRFEALFRALI